MVSEAENGSHPSRGRILVVDDARFIRLVLRGILTRGAYEVDEAESGARALEMLAKANYDVVITDLRMPGLDGFGVLAGVKRVAPHVEVVILTGTHAKDMDCALRALRLGAHDYMAKPPSSPEAVLLTVERAVEKKRLKDANDRLMRDLESLSRRDPLTGMLNRRSLDETLPNEVARARRHGHPLSVVMFDIDHFKKVNDTHGHRGGDRVLRAFAERVAGLLREGDTLFRYGGEEFLALLPHADARGAQQAAERILEAVAATPVDLLHCRIAITASAGVGSLTHSMAPESDLIDSADEALYAAKRSGRNRVRVAGGHTALALVAGLDRQ